MRKVAYCSLHAPFFFPGLGNMSKELHQGSAPGIEMYLTESGLEATYKKVSFFIPTPNIVGVVFDKVKSSPELKPVA